jgi:uncharacterized protein YndB with AHSA1/START domain
MSTMDMDKQELIIMRTFNVPTPILVDTWMNQLQLGPKDLTNPVFEIDTILGGAFRIDTKSPDGNTYSITGTYDDILVSKKLIYICKALDGFGKELFEIINIIEFIKHGNKTIMKINETVSNTSIESAWYLEDMEDGWNNSLDRLIDLIDN